MANHRVCLHYSDLMTQRDPIAEETRSRREELARRFNYDIKTSGEALKRQQMGSGQTSRSVALRSVFELLRHNTALQPTPLTRRG